MQHGNGDSNAQHIAPQANGHQYNGHSHQIYSGSGACTIINQATATPNFDNARNEILQSLYMSPYLKRKNRNPDRVPGTCEWFMSHPEFHHWRDNTSSAMLWVSANPGCGKSVLAKYLVDELKTAGPRTTCYFFFKDDFEDQRSATSALSCILHQLFVQREDLFSAKVVKRFISYKKPLVNSHYELWELWDILILATQERDAGELICILDAFDECGDKERKVLGKILSDFYGSSNDIKNINLKFLITSRPYDTIRQELINPIDTTICPVIHLKGDGDVEIEKIAAEINLYIQHKILRLRLAPGEEIILLQGLSAVHNQTYLWVYLTLEWIQTEIGNKLNEVELRKVIETLPRTVDEAYDKILFKSTDIEETKKLLHIVVAAERPLTLQEMDIALAIRQHHKSYESLGSRPPKDRVSKYIRDLCGFFINITDGKIYLLHQTAKEFLVPKSNMARPGGILATFGLSLQKQQPTQLTWKSSLTPSESHLILCKICIWHLLFDELDTHPLTEGKEIFNYLDTNPFLEYSAKYWSTHFRASQMEEDEIIEHLQLICDSRSARFLTWFKVYWAGTHNDLDFPLDFTTIMAASYFGLKSVVKSQLRLPGVEIDCVDSTHKRTPLSWASENGFEGVVKLLVKSHPRFQPGTSVMEFIMEFIKRPFFKGAEVDAKDKIKRTPLSYASWNGHLSVVQRLVRAGACADSKDENGGTPISYALSTGQQDIANVLKAGTQNSSIDEIRDRLLLSAVRNGHSPIVKRLLDSGADIKGSKSAYTPLSIAAENGYEPVVKLLLNSGANIEGCEHFNTPLYAAAENGYKSIVKLLLNSGANIEGRKGFFTPLSIAVEYGHESIVELLLNSGADIEGRKGIFTPLSIARKRKHESIVKLLLSKGAE